MDMETTVQPKTPGAAGVIGKILVVVLLAAAVAGVVALKQRPVAPDDKAAPVDQKRAAVGQPAPTQAALPRLVDLGATKCVPCKMMAPILEELKKEHAGKLEVVFIDVWEKPEEADVYGVKMIPTQIFFDAAGKERFRHEGFFSKEDILAKWRELGVELGASASSAAAEPAFSRLEPMQPDARPKESVCYMCDGDVNPKTRTVLHSEKGEVNFCSPHCYFIMCSSMVPPKRSHEDASVADWAGGAPAPAAAATYLLGMDGASHPVIKAFADPAAAELEQRAAGGNLLGVSALQDREMENLCGFCDRAVYPADACAVRVGGLNTWGCCTMCALGVAARMQKDIEVTAKDALTGEAIHVSTANGVVSALEPATAVAWAGTKKDDGGKLVSTGCFKQAFFTNEENLRKWVEAHPAATGRMISINQALAEKMKLTAEQISKACKIGECAPK